MNDSSLPCCEACLRNQAAIAEALSHLKITGHVLELGSGTGQHAAFIAKHLPELVWHPSDQSDSLSHIEKWRQASGQKNIKAALEIDVTHDLVDNLEQFEGVFTANTIHYVSDRLAERFLVVASQALKPQGRLMVYGPFNEGGEFTSEGNLRLDEWLKLRDPLSGLKDRSWLDQAALGNRLGEARWIGMPANNWLAVYTKQPA